MGSEVDALERWGGSTPLNGGWRLPRDPHIVHVAGCRTESEAVGSDAHLRQAANRVVVQQK